MIECGDGYAEACPAYDDGVHCDHWWDDLAPCCGCGDDSGREMSDAARDEFKVGHDDGA